MPGMSVSVAWFRRSWYDLPISVNQLVDPDTDWTPFETTNPLTGETMTLYNLNPAKAGQALFLDSTSTDHSKTRRDYTGFELGATVRLPRGGTLIGGWAADRTINVTCENADPNLRYNCDQSAFDIPLRSDFKFIGTYPVGYGVQLGAVLQSYAGAAVPVSWSVPASVYPGGRRTAAAHLVDDGRRHRLYGIEPQRPRNDVSAPLEPAGCQRPADLPDRARVRGWKPGHVQCDELQRRAEPEPGVRALARGTDLDPAAEAVPDFEHAEVLIYRSGRCEI